MSLYDRVILDDYVRTGEAEVVIMHDRFNRPGDRWHMLEIHVNLAINIRLEITRVINKIQFRHRKMSKASMTLLFESFRCRKFVFSNLEIQS